MNALDLGIMGSEELVRKTGSSLIRNAGKIIAILSAAVAILLTFTDVRLGSLSGNDLTGELVMMLAAAYVIYFSLEDAGEKLGMQTKEYESAAAEYEQMRRLIDSKDTEALREFCIRYSEEELAYRKRAMLVNAGLSEGEMQAWLEGEDVPRRKARIFRRINAMKATPLTPQMLLNRERVSRRSELSSPEKFKHCRMAIGLIPTTVGMCITVSVMLTVKNGLTPECVIEGLIKLAALPMVAFRGYSSGYSHVRDRGVGWLETRTRILRAFKSEGCTK
jgi:hypothetical protein